jgi:hypothetical protein
MCSIPTIALRLVIQSAHTVTKMIQSTQLGVSLPDRSALQNHSAFAVIVQLYAHRREVTLEVPAYLSRQTGVSFHSVRSTVSNHW